MGVAILLIHIINLLTKKNKREDENRLLLFLVFTAIHFATYLTFSLIKNSYTSDPFIIGFYTTFYIFNNIEVLLFFLYAIAYVEIEQPLRKIIVIVNISLFSIITILDIINIFTGMFFTSVDGVYLRSNMMIISQGYQFVLFAVVFFVMLFNKNLAIREKVSFASYCLLPLVAIVLQNVFKGYAIAYASIIVATEILFFSLNVRKNILLAEEKEKNKDAQIKIMMSQIQPHFIYNSLSSISTLITIDPEKAQNALDEFTEYLRRNLSSLTETRLIPFDDELRHIETYIALEKIRFNERIKVVYNIEATNFFVPPLSIQPIVENAIKHGILKKVEGGTLVFKTYEKEDAFVVEVIDDGVGFDMSNVDFKNNVHFGINNIKHRINNMCNGDIVINSEVDKGTRVVVTFFK
jgi:sensor histidine kinase YesM